ncbi:MAG TPA: RNA polymerase sigma factor [Ilumatobacteraceae bacterium]
MTDDDVLALYERSVDSVYRYATRLTGGDRSWADELVQDTFLQLVRLVREHRATEVDAGWLMVACRHRFVDQLRQQRRRHAREVAVAGPVPDSAGDGRAVAALDRLPADQRLVLVLKYVDELSVAEVAREIGRSVHATESLLARARTALRAVIDQEVRP